MMNGTGAPIAPAFGGGTSAFGGAFGQPTAPAPAFGQPTQTPAFGTTFGNPTTAPAPAFGAAFGQPMVNSAFGQPVAQAAFGQPTNVPSVQPAAPSMFPAAFNQPRPVATTVPTTTQVPKAAAYQGFTQGQVTPGAPSSSSAPKTAFTSMNGFPKQPTNAIAQQSPNNFTPKATTTTTTTTNNTAWKSQPARPSKLSQSPITANPWPAKSTGKMMQQTQAHKQRIFLDDEEWLPNTAQPEIIIDTNRTRRRPDSVECTGEDHWTEVKQDWKNERTKAIRMGIINDPDAQINLSEAKPLHGTCLDMCPFAERIDRAYKNEIDPLEISVDGVFDRRTAVKAFHRSAAGTETGLPSDVRPPTVLVSTLNYLLSLMRVTNDMEYCHSFIRDRTRAIRKDFSIQPELLGPETIYCYERIARFHILSIHQMCEVKTFDLPMEREQLDKTMTSLLEFYNDARAKDPAVKFPNEAEFRAYALVLDYKSTDSLSLLARLPDNVRNSKHIQQATALFSRMQINNQASRERLSDAPPDLVLNDVQSFFDLVFDENVPYLLGCIATLAFKDIRMCALRAIYGGLQPGSTYNQILFVQQLLGLDSLEQAQKLAQICGIQTQESPTGDYLVIPRPNERIQWTAESRSFPTFQSQLLEQKRGTDGSGQALSLYDIVNVSGYYQEISQQIVSTKAIVINTPIISSKTNQIRIPSIGTNRSTENESVHEKDVQIPSKPLGYVPTFDMAYIQRKLNEEHERADSSLVVDTQWQRPPETSQTESPFTLDNDEMVDASPIVAGNSTSAFGFPQTTSSSTLSAFAQPFNPGFTATITNPVVSQNQTAFIPAAFQRKPSAPTPNIFSNAPTDSIFNQAMPQEQGISQTVAPTFSWTNPTVTQSPFGQPTSTVPSAFQTKTADSATAQQSSAFGAKMNDVAPAQVNYGPAFALPASFGQQQAPSTAETTTPATNSLFAPAVIRSDTSSATANSTKTAPASVFDAEKPPTTGFNFFSRPKAQDDTNQTVSQSPVQSVQSFSFSPSNPTQLSDKPLSSDQVSTSFRPSINKPMAPQIEPFDSKDCIESNSVSTWASLGHNKQRSITNGDELSIDGNPTSSVRAAGMLAASSKSSSSVSEDVTLIPEQDGSNQALVTTATNESISGEDVDADDDMRYEHQVARATSNPETQVVVKSTTKEKIKGVNVEPLQPQKRREVFPSNFAENFKQKGKLRRESLSKAFSNVAARPWSPVEPPKNANYDVAISYPPKVWAAVPLKSIFTTVVERDMASLPHSWSWRLCVACDDVTGQSELFLKKKLKLEGNDDDYTSPGGFQVSTTRCGKKLKSSYNNVGGLVFGCSSSSLEGDTPSISSPSSSLAAIKKQWTLDRKALKKRVDAVAKESKYGLTILIIAYTSPIASGKREQKCRAVEKVLNIGDLGPHVVAVKVVLLETLEDVEDFPEIVGEFAGTVSQSVQYALDHAPEFAARRSMPKRNHEQIDVDAAAAGGSGIVSIIPPQQNHRFNLSVGSVGGNSSNHSNNHHQSSGNGGHKNTNIDVTKLSASMSRPIKKRLAIMRDTGSGMTTSTATAASTATLAPVDSPSQQHQQHHQQSSSSSPSSQHVYRPSHRTVNASPMFYNFGLPANTTAQTTTTLSKNEKKRSIIDDKSREGRGKEKERRTIIMKRSSLLSSLSSTTRNPGEESRRMSVDGGNGYEYDNAFERRRREVDDDGDNDDEQTQENQVQPSVKEILAPSLTSLSDALASLNDILTRAEESTV